MRLAHHLLRHRSGVWHFRLIVPRDLQAMIGLKVIKKSLGTRDAAEARMWAYMLGARYAQIFGRARESDVPKTRNTGWELEFQLEGEPGQERLMPRALKTNGSDEDNASGLEALKTVLATMSVRRSSTALDAAPPAPEVPRGHRVLSSKVAAAWLAAIKEETLPKTHQIKRAAVESFVQHFGGKKPISEAMREDVSAWIQALRSTGLATPTLANKAGYLTAFFDWCVGQGYCAPFQSDKHNPARGVVVYRKKDKQRRTKETGYKPFSREDIQRLFAPEALAGLAKEARWGLLLGLYTGARVSEIGQLALDDILEVDGIPCLRLTDEQPGQSLKTEASRRTIPIHPHLIELGLLDRVDRLRQAGKTRLFPAVKVGGVNGMGNWLSKAFFRYRTEVGIAPPGKGKHGFHSFRSTLIQALQDLRVPAEIRAAYVGHDLDDEHHNSYSREVRPAEMLDAVSSVGWMFDFRAILKVIQVS